MIGPEGEATMVVYFMEKQDSGIWWIAGVSIIPWLTSLPNQLMQVIRITSLLLAGLLSFIVPD